MNTVMHFDIVTLFPDMLHPVFNESMMGRAQREGLLSLCLRNPREHTTDKHRTVDDAPYGGGPGMLLKPEPIVRTVEEAVREGKNTVRPRITLFAPQGVPFNQAYAEEMAKHPWHILICGHYEGIDDRVRQLLNAELVSIGDYVLTGGEPAAIVVVDAVARLIPGVLGGSESVQEESFGDHGLLEYPQYTRPAEYRGLSVPDVLVSGHHGNIARWRRQQALLLTRFRRPDLWDKVRLTEEDKALLGDLHDLYRNDDTETD